MSDKVYGLNELMRDVPNRSRAAARSVPDAGAGNGQNHDEEEDACGCFGYLRGVRDRALAVEFRLRTGNSEWLPYSCLVAWRFNPSVGLLLKFAADVTTLVLIRGSNLDALVNDSMNLTDRGIQRHRITYVREMDEDELRRAGSREPTIDGIDIAEFQTVEAQQEWLKKQAPGFVRPQR